MLQILSRKARKNTDKPELCKLASEGKDYPMLKKLMREDSVNRKDREGKTPLHQAAIKGQHVTVKRLLSDPKINIKILDSLGKPAMHYAVQGGCQDVAVANAFLEAPEYKTSELVEVCDRNKRTILHEALDNGSNAVELVSKPELICLPDSRGRTPLHYAARCERTDAAKSLLKKCADIMAKDKDGQTVLHWAARYGHARMVQMFIDRGADAAIKNKDGHTALHMAAVNGHHAAAMLLLYSNKLKDEHEEKALLLIDKRSSAGIEASAKNKRELLLWAAKEKKTAVAKLLLAKKVDELDTDGLTPLVWATKNGLAVTELVLDVGAEVGKPDARGRTPLLWAAHRGHAAIVDLLLKSDAEVDTKDEARWRSSLLATVIRCCHTFKLLIARGSEPGSPGLTQLVRCATRSHDVFTEKMFKTGAVDKRDCAGRRPPLLDTFTRYCQAFNLLDEQGHSGLTPVVRVANRGRVTSFNWAIDARTGGEEPSHRKTPLTSAASEGHGAVVKLLLDAGADVNRPDGSGLMALAQAVEHKHGAVAKLLLEASARVDVQDASGRMALKWARDNRDHPAAEMIVAASKAASPFSKAASPSSTAASTSSTADCSSSTAAPPSSTDEAPSTPLDSGK